MRNNKAILDEAARSVRRTFVGSVAGSIGMLAVVGAAGAYGMPEKLTAHAFSVAMAKFNVKFPKVEHAAPGLDRLVQIADNAKLRVVTDAAPEDAIVRTVPQVVAEVALLRTKEQHFRLVLQIALTILGLRLLWSAGHGAGWF